MTWYPCQFELSREVQDILTCTTSQRASLKLLPVLQVLPVSLVADCQLCDWTILKERQSTQDSCFSLTKVFSSVHV